MNLRTLPKPFFVLAPMDDVTDTVFRQIVADCAKPDLYVTEFVNVDGLQSPGREKLLPKLRLGPQEGLARVSHLDEMQGDGEKRSEAYQEYVERVSEPTTQQFVRSTNRVSGSAGKQVSAVRKSWPIIAQIWGKDPKNFYETAKDLVEMGFDGVDINFGCPEKSVIKNGCCIGMINNRELAGEIITAVREAVGTSLPVSVKTRLGLGEVDYTWHEFLLKQKLNMLTIHGRTAKHLSKVPADWQAIEHIRKLRDQLFPTTLIVGNGDVKNRIQGESLAKKHGLDGIMIGRGIFDDPFLFAKLSPWAGFTREQRLELYSKHVKLFAQTWTNNEHKIYTLNKFCKVYINGFDGAKELREQLMAAGTAEDLLVKLITD